MSWSRMLTDGCRKMCIQLNEKSVAWSEGEHLRNACTWLPVVTDLRLHHSSDHYEARRHQQHVAVVRADEGTRSIDIEV